MNSKPDVVISGIGGTFPNSLDLDEFKEILLENKNTAGKAKWFTDGSIGNPYYNNMPHKRDYLFDAFFFGIHHVQTIYLDSMARALLEKTFEALVDAGVNPSEIRGKTVPVFIGSVVSETDSDIYKSVKSGFGVTGQARTMMANRISYWLNIQGASLTMDANWNSGIQVIENAVAMIQSGMCDSVIVGITNYANAPFIHWYMEQRGLLAKNGKTKAFDEHADGYSRSDGFIVLYLQRADLAKRNYATIVHAHNMFNGNRTGDLIECNPDHYAKFLEECYETSGVNPNNIAYLETYGCGIKEIDEKEIEAIEKAFCKNRNTPLLIGSVKTNIGHGEATSAFMSLIKAIITMETGIIPANLNYNHPNTRIPALTNGKIEVVTKNKEWTGELIAINSIGLTTIYGHMILRRNLQTKKGLTTDLPLLLKYSTRTEEGIKQISGEVQRQLQSPDLSYNKLTNDVFSTNINGHLYHAYSLKASTYTSAYKHFSGVKPPIWFIYSGMGSQWHTMGRDLLKLPIFAAAVNKCHNILKPKGVDLIKIITDDNPNIFDNILHSFVGIAAIQIGLTDVLNAIGIYPDGMIGHSVGELGCAYADKCLTAEQMILSAYYRGKASLEANLIPGMMAAVGKGHKELQNICPIDIDIACHNSPSSCTISGSVESVTKFAKFLQTKEIFVKLVNVSNIAYHSRYIKPAAPLLLSYLKEIIPCPKERSPKWLSTSISQSEWDSDLARNVSAKYLTNNLLSFVQFEECLPFIPNNAVAIEIAPHGLLQAILKRALPSDVVNVALTKRDTNCLEYLFDSLGQLYLNGLEFNVSPLYPEVPQPVPRGTRSLCKLIQWEHGKEWGNHGNEVLYTSNERTFNVNLDTSKFEYLNHCRIDNRIIAPPSLYFGLVMEILNKDECIKNITFENVVFKNFVEIHEKDVVSISVMLQTATEYFEITHNKKIIVTGQVIRDNNEKLPSAQVENNEEFLNMNENNFYKELNIKGYQFPDEYKLMSSLSFKEKGFKAIAKHSDDWKAFVNAVFQMHLFHSEESTQRMVLTKYIQRLKMSFDDFEKNNNNDPLVFYNSKTNILESNNGVHISGIKYQQFETISNNINIENLQFMQHFNKYYENIDNGFKMCAKLLAENICTQHLIITELKEKYTPKYLPYIKSYLNQQQIDVTATEMNELDYSALQDSSLTIVSGKFINIASQIISHGSNFFLFCFPNTHSMVTSNKYSLIAQFSNNNNNFHLVKKASMSPIKVININDDKLSYNNIQTYSKPWTLELQIMTKDRRIYLISRTVPVEGVRKFVSQMQNLDYGHILRFLFILDQDAPEYNPESKFYTRVFEQDLVVQSFYKGTWGSFFDISATFQFDETKTSSSLMRTLQTNDLLNICKLNLGLHPKDLTRIDDDSIPCSMGAMDFSGVNSSGERIMGFAQTDLDHCKIMTDPEFTWTVPNNWSLCDAATVPFAYTMAYHTLFVVGNISKGDKVLVHAGASDIGQAALHVAYNYGCVVYTTVKNEQQKALVKQLVPMILDEYIFFETSNFELAILEITKGRGVDVILNCLPGDRLTASTRVLANFSRFIQLGTLDMTQYSTTGMKFLLKCCSFHGVTGQHLLELPQEVKKELKEMITKDMIRGVVRPIPRRIVTENRIEDSLRYLRSSASNGAAVLQLNNIRFAKSHVIPKSDNYRNENQDSYFIYADLSDSWLSLVAWLAKRGAKRIIIANVINQIKNFIKRFLSTIKQSYDTEIIMQKNDAKTIQSSKLLVDEMTEFGSMTSFIFATDDNKNNNLFENIYTALRENKLKGRMVCISGTNKENSYFKANGIPICNVVWDKIYCFQEVIKNFDVVLNQEDSLNIYLKDDSTVNKGKSKGGIEIVKDDSTFLPDNLKTLKHVGQNELEAANLVQLTSNISKEIRECLPVFLVPGLAGPHCPSLRQFVARLMHPVFCVNLPPAAVQDDIAVDLAKQIIQVKQLKVYKLIGVSWGGILAIEIAKQLENMGKKTELYLIDGAPKTVQNFTKPLFNKSGAFNTVLLKQLIKVESKSIENILSSSDISKLDYKVFIKSLSVLKNLIEYSNFYKPLPNKLNGATTLILPETNSEESLGLTEHCEQISYKSMRGNHLTILQNETLPDFVNDNLV